MPDQAPSTSTSARSTRTAKKISLSDVDSRISKVVGKTGIRLTPEFVRELREKLLQEMMDQLTPAKLEPLIRQELDKIKGG